MRHATEMPHILDCLVARNPRWPQPWALDPIVSMWQVRFFEVSAEELVKQRQSFKDGQLAIRIEDDVFDMAKHNAFVDSIAEETAAFKAVQQKAAAEQVRPHV